MSKLTPKQEKFCLAYLESGNATDAYRKAGYSAKMGQKTATEASSRLLRNSNVIAMIESVRKPVREAAQITVADLVKELEEARLAALSSETVQASAAVGASMGKAKLLGFLIDKLQVDMSVGLADKVKSARERAGK